MINFYMKKIPLFEEFIVEKEYCENVCCAVRKGI
jgi:hypothetical protein